MVTSGRLRTSRAGLELIKSFEGFRETAARLPDGRWTIGYGHVRTAREGGSITESAAEDLLRNDLRMVEEALLDLVYTPINQNQFDALVSLVANISPGQFKDSGILRSLNAGDYLAAAAGFDAWRKARIHGRVIVVDALVRRRAMEKAMFLEHPDGRPAAPTPLVTPELDLNGVEAHPVHAQPAVAQPAAQAAGQAAARPAADLDIAEAIRRLANPANDTAEPKAAPDSNGAIDAEFTTDTAFEPANESDAAQTDQPATETAAEPRRASQSIEEARRVVSDRLARILARNEEAASETRPEPKPAEPAARPVPREPVVLEGMPDFDAAPLSPTPRPAAAEQRNGRTFIDDTETFDPGRDPDDLFVEGVRAAEIVNGRASRLGLFGGRIVLVAPWIGILVLAIIGLGIGLVESFRGAAAETALSGASTVTAVFGLMVVMSLYFIITRANETEV